MARLSAIGSLFLFANTVSAQVALQATFVTDTEFVAEAWYFGSRQTQRWGIGTDLTTSPRLEATAGQGFSMANATTSIGWTNSPHGLTASITETHTVSGLPVSAGTGPHDARLRLSSRQPTSVRVRVAIAGTTTTHCFPYIGSSYAGFVDFDGDGQWDVTAANGRTQSREWTVTLDATGIEIITRSGGHASIIDGGGSTSSRCDIRIEVVPVDAVVVDWRTDTLTQCSAGMIFPRVATLADRSVLGPVVDVAVPCDSRATVAARTYSAPDRVRMTLQEEAVGDASIPSHDSLVTLRAPAPTAMRLFVRIAATTSTAATWSATLDVGDDGSFELSSVPNQVVVLSTVVVANPVGLPIRLRARAQSAGRTTGFAAGMVEIEISPLTACLTATRGAACGVGLNGLVTLANQLALDVTTPTPNTVGKLLIGTQQLDLPLWFSPCRLYTDPIVAIPLLTDATGTARLRFDLPPELAGLLVVQSLTLTRSGPLELAASHALEIACQ